MSCTISSLASLASLITKGTTPTTLGYAHSDSGIPFLRVQNIFGGQVNFDEDTLFIDAVTHNALRRSQIQGGDVLVTIAGTIGRTGVVPLGAPDMNCNQAVAIVRPKEGIDRNYLRYWLESQDARGQMLGSTVTGTISNLSLSQLGALKVPVPTLEAQRRIAAILDKADALRVKRHEALAQLDRLAQSIFLEMFGDPATNPKGWPTVQLSTLVSAGDSINYGVVQPGDDTEEGVPLVRVGDLQGGCVSHLDLKKIDPQIESAYKRSRLKGDEILVSCVGSIGVVALATEAENGFNIARAVARVRLGDAVERQYMAEHLRSESVQNYFRQELRTVSQPTLNIKQIAATLVMLPPKTLQTEFVRRVSAVKALTTSQLQASKKTANLFASLQKHAFQGAL